MGLRDRMGCADAFIGEKSMLSSGMVKALEMVRMSGKGKRRRGRDGNIVTLFTMIR